jgi:hypothetical protein
MAEVIGVVASIAQLVQLGAQVLTIGYGYLAKVARAPAEVRGLLSENAAVCTLLGHIEEVADSSTGSEALVTLQQRGVLKECHEILMRLKTTLDKCQIKQDQDRGKLRNRLIWPLREREMREHIQKLVRLRGLLNSALTVDSA